MRYLFVLVALVIGACTTSKPIRTQTGAMGSAIDCSGIQHTWNSCLERAGKICGERGYDILQRSDQQGVTGTAGPGGMLIGSTYYRSMVIQCKSAP